MKLNDINNLKQKYKKALNSLKYPKYKFHEFVIDEKILNLKKSFLNKNFTFFLNKNK